MEERTTARELLAAAREAQAAGARAGARPTWYPVALGASVALAVASFAVPSLTITGIVLGAVIAPVVLESVARRRTGASPAKDYLARGRRVPALTWVVVTAVVVGTALVHLKVTGALGGVLLAAVVAGLVTVGCARSVNRARLGPAAR